MNRHHPMYLHFGAGLLLATLASGCATTSRPVDFYTLSPVASAAGSEAPRSGCRDVVIGIGPVLWPRYIDRPQIVSRLSPNRVSFDEFHRWASPPEEEFTRVLSDDLSRLLQTDYVIKYPGKLSYKPRYRVQIHVDQFDGRPGEAVTLKATWVVVDQGNDKNAALHSTDLHVPTEGAGYEPMVAAASEAVAELSRRIAAELSSRCGNQR